MNWPPPGTREWARLLSEARCECHPAATAFPLLWAAKAAVLVGRSYPAVSIELFTTRRRTFWAWLVLLRPWNVSTPPFVLKIAPALIYGNTIVFQTL